MGKYMYRLMNNMFRVQPMGYFLSADITMVTGKGVSAVLTNMFGMSHKQNTKALN
jgi:hypothetical protein